MTDPKGTWTDGGKVWEGRPEPAVGGESGYRAAWLELLELCNKLKKENFDLRAAQPESPLREGAESLVQRFEMESMALHKTQRAWLVREIGKALATQPASPLPAVGGEAAAWEKRWPGKEWEPIMEPTPDHLTRLINSGREVRPLYAAQPASPLRVTGAINLVEEAACLIWSELCPGMVMGDDDIPHYEAAAKAVLALPASPLRGREALAKMFLSMWKNGNSPLQIADAMLAAQPTSPLRETCIECGECDPCDDDCPNSIEADLVFQSPKHLVPSFSASPPEQPAAVPTNGYEVAYQALKKAGDALSFAAQTSGGTAGRDDGLMTAIGDWQIAKDKARAMRRIEKFEPAAVLSAIPETGRESIREIVYANAQTTLIGFNEISDQNVEFICDQISRKVELALSAPEQPAADPVAEREWMSIASPHTVKMLLDTITAKNARIGELEEALGKAVLAPVTGRMCPYCFGLGKIENPTDPDEELPKARPMGQS